jgi:hypothetical protein
MKNKYILKLYYVIIDISSSDICDKDQEKRDDARSILEEECDEFILIRALLRSNNPMSRLVVLC